MDSRRTDARRSDGGCVKLRPGSMANPSVVWLHRAMSFLPLANTPPGRPPGAPTSLPLISWSGDTSYARRSPNCSLPKRFPCLGSAQSRADPVKRVSQPVAFDFPLDPGLRVHPKTGALERVDVASSSKGAVARVPASHAYSIFGWQFANNPRDATPRERRARARARGLVPAVPRLLPL